MAFERNSPLPPNSKERDGFKPSRVTSPLGKWDGSTWVQIEPTNRTVRYYMRSAITDWSKPPDLSNCPIITWK